MTDTSAALELAHRPYIQPGGAPAGSPQGVAVGAVALAGLSGADENNTVTWYPRGASGLVYTLESVAVYVDFGYTGAGDAAKTTVLEDEITYPLFAEYVQYPLVGGFNTDGVTLPPQGWTSSPPSWARSVVDDGGGVPRVTRMTSWLTFERHPHHSPDYPTSLTGANLNRILLNFGRIGAGYFGNASLLVTWQYYAATERLSAARSMPVYVRGT